VEPERRREALSSRGVGASIGFVSTGGEQNEAQASGRNRGDSRHEPDRWLGERVIGVGSAGARHLADLGWELRDARRARNSFERHLLDSRLLQVREIDCGGSASAATASRRTSELDVEGRNTHDPRALADLRPLRHRRDATNVLPGDVSKFVRSLYRSARMANDIETLASGNPKRITRRAKNKLLGRALGHSGFWRFLWR
jgi:hypothetical protein